jgi:hypothetical protein
MPGYSKHSARLHLEELESRDLLATSGWGSVVLLPPLPVAPGTMFTPPSVPDLHQVEHLGWDVHQAGSGQTTALRDARYRAIDQAANDFTPAREACFTDHAWMERLAARDTYPLLPAEEHPAPQQDRDALLTAAAVALGGFWSVRMEVEPTEAQRRQGFFRV